MCSRWLALLSVTALAAAATRPHYGGTLRVEVQQSVETADPPQTGRGLADLAAGFTISRWEAGRLAVYSADETAGGGRPYLDQVEVQMGRPLRDQAIDLELGKADVVQFGMARPAGARKTWTSAPVRLLALIFAARVGDARVREALAWSVDRAAIHSVLLQKQGESTSALLPQWISGYAFLFPTAPDLNRARSLAAGIPAGARALSLGFEDAGLRSIAERVALNARDAGLAVTVNAGGNPDVKLTEIRIESDEPARALAGVAAALGLPEPPAADTPGALAAGERALLAGYRVIPLFHLPDVYGVSPRVKNGPGITPLGAWRFPDLWVEGSRP
jgi:peptide/nickel transport system substrate-binding protein